MTDTTPPDPIDPAAPAAATAATGTAAAATPWYKRPLTWVIAAVIAAVAALGLILAFGAGDDDASYSIATITRVDDAGEPLQTEMVGTVRAPSSPESFRWLTPADANAPEPALSRANSAGTVTFQWEPTEDVADRETWRSTLTVTELLPPNSTLEAARFECRLRRAGEPESTRTLDVVVETPDDPAAPSSATYTFENFEFLPADVMTCAVSNGVPGTTTTSTTSTTSTTTAPTTVPETTAPETTAAPTTAPATTVAPPPTSTPETSAPATSVPATSVMGVIEGRADLSTLVGLIDTAGLRETLSNPGTITLFAPDNDAFDALLGSPEAPDIADPAAVQALLLAHTNLREVLLAADVLALAEVSVENGGPQPVDVDAGTVGGAEIAEADLAADNGVVHVVRSVMPIQP